MSKEAMTKNEALRLALSTLNEVRQETFRLLRNGERLYSEEKVWSTIYEIKKALETKEQEPVAWMTFNAYGDEDDIHYENPEGHLLEGWTYKPLYTTPQSCPTCQSLARTVMMDQTGYDPRPWVGLTDEEIKQACWESGPVAKRHAALRAALAWVGLTDEDRQELAAEQHSWERLCSAVEAKLKDKNYG